MKIGAPRETMAGENRVSMTPDSALQLQKLGYECFVEAGAGEPARFADDDYRAAGVTVVKSANELISAVDIVTKVRGPSKAELKKLWTNDETFRTSKFMSALNHRLELLKKKVEAAKAKATAAFEKRAGPCAAPGTPSQG